jgi:dienelactone hydrolase
MAFKKNGFRLVLVFKKITFTTAAPTIFLFSFMRYPFFILPFFFLASCQSNPKPVLSTTETEQAPIKFEPDTFAIGKIISPVALHADTVQSFALYLPKQYSDTAKFPVIFFFDPHANGTLPLNLYQHLADKYNYILIGSNVSKNGMSVEQTNAVVNNLIADIKARFVINEKQIALCGFSGGAKVALLNAADNEDISSVIYCGAAIELPPTAGNFSLLGFAGKRDMNYTDVIIFDQSQNTSERKHCLIEHEGKHEWVDENTFENAFLFLENKADANKCFRLSRDMEGRLGLEHSSKQVYSQALQTKDLSWWKTEIAKLNAKKKNDLMCERLLGFISLACYSYTNNALQQNDLLVAEHLLAIYALADPGNKDCAAFAEELKRRK